MHDDSCCSSCVISETRVYKQAWCHITPSLAGQTLAVVWREAAPPARDGHIIPPIILFLNSSHIIKNYSSQFPILFHMMQTLQDVASFPGLPHLQFLIACSMQQAIKNWRCGRPGNEANRTTKTCTGTNDTSLIFSYFTVTLQ